jgi:hypothetical protein
MRWYNPARGLFRLFERNPVTGELEIIRSPRGIGKELMQDEDTVMDAARHGLKFSWTDSQAYERSARVMLEKIAAQMRDVPVLGKSLKMARDIQHWRHEGLWKNTHDALKIIAYDDLVTKALQDAPPGVDAKAIKEEISSRLNDTFGGQEWQTKFWLSPTSRKIISRFMLAPDWTLSTLRSVPFLSSAASTVRGNLPRVAGREPIPTTPTTFAGNLGRAKFWSGELAALAIGTIAIQYAIYQMFGDKRKGDKQWIWENEAGQNRRIDATPLMRKLPWRDPKDPTRYYVNMGKRPEEILTWVIDPIQNMRSKMSRPVAEVFKQVTGQEGGFKADWAREHQSFVEGIPGRIKSASQTMVPFVFGGNQFALSVPYRKGMTKFKAQEAYESAFGLIAEPNRFRQALRGVPPTQDAIQNLLRDISDAAERNGVPAIEIYKRARSAVRSRYYGDYFKAFSKGDMDAANKAAVALIRLGATTENIRESVKRRHELEAK